MLYYLDPVVGNEVVAAGIGCDMPSLENPYSASHRLQFTAPVVMSILIGFGLVIF